MLYWRRFPWRLISDSFGIYLHHMPLLCSERLTFGTKKADRQSTRRVHRDHSTTRPPKAPGNCDTMKHQENKLMKMVKTVTLPRSLSFASDLKEFIKEEYWMFTWRKHITGLLVAFTSKSGVVRAFMQMFIDSCLVVSASKL
ncbi:uncharacterized protein LOC130759147 [Actinidia eriantha]|uniref:uncharacterized protein LOC130759147 n=1 Tax=Actinidia eriantha TaxID=165200 RepID=UPI00258899C2|nr:uncharacterized protein LOC130759147 [Actinidia eriantha]